MRENESEDRKQPQKETRQANLQLKCLSQDKFCAYAKVGQDTGKGHKDLWLGLCRAGLEWHYAYAALSTILSPIYVWVCVPQLTNATTARECEHKARPRPMGPRPKAKAKPSQACPGECQCNSHTHTHTHFLCKTHLNNAAPPCTLINLAATFNNFKKMSPWSTWGIATEQGIRKEYLLDWNVYIYNRVDVCNTIKNAKVAANVLDFYKSSSYWTTLLQASKPIKYLIVSPATALFSCAD